MTVQITEEQLQQAEGQAEEAAGALKEAERAYAANRASRAAYDTHFEAVRRADHAKTRLGVLREGWQEQQEARDRRAAAGEAAAQELAPEVKQLAKSRETAVKAVVAAAVAMGKALAALDGHDQRVRAMGAELGRRGLRGVDGEATGVSLDGAPRIGGEAWQLVDSAGVLAACLAEEVAAVWPRHPLAQARWVPSGGVAAARGRDELLALVRAERGR